MIARKEQRQVGQEDEILEEGNSYETNCMC